MRPNLLTRSLAVVALLACTPAVAPAQVNYDFAVETGGFTSVDVGNASNSPWTYGLLPTAPGGGNAWSTPGQSVGVDPFIGGASALVSGAMTVSADGVVTGSFTHRFNFETDFFDGTPYDGGQLQFRIGSEAWQTVTANLISGVSYGPFPIADDFESPIAGQLAFTGQSAGFFTPEYVTSDFTLGAGTAATFSAGDVIQIRFLGAFDNSVSTGGEDWQIGSVSLTNVNPVPEPASVLGFAALAGAVGYRLRRRTPRAGQATAHRV